MTPWRRGWKTEGTHEKKSGHTAPVAVRGTITATTHNTPLSASHIAITIARTRLSGRDTHTLHVERERRQTDISEPTRPIHRPGRTRRAARIP